MKKAAVIVALAAFGVILLWSVGKMPEMGDSRAPDKTHVIPRYIEEGVEEAGAENLVTDVILNYRGYDTMGEVAVIFSALCAVIALLNREKRGSSRSEVDISPVRSSKIVNTTVRILFPVIFLFAFYIILHGETSAGGGFQGGAVIGASIIVFTLAFTLIESTRDIPLPVRVVMESLAVLTFLAVGFTGIFAGAQFLTYILPGLSPGVAETLRSQAFMMSIEIAIGIAVGAIFTSIVFAMIKEEQYELEPHLSKP